MSTWLVLVTILTKKAKNLPKSAEGFVFKVKKPMFDFYGLIGAIALEAGL